jgi:hypothetical protein
MVATYRRKAMYGPPLEVEAWQADHVHIVHTPDGERWAELGDWVVKVPPNGDRYVLFDCVFRARFERSMPPEGR